MYYFLKKRGLLTVKGQLLEILKSESSQSKLSVKVQKTKNCFFKIIRDFSYVFHISLFIHACYV